MKNNNKKNHFLKKSLFLNQIVDSFSDPQFLKISKENSVEVSWFIFTNDATDEQKENTGEVEIEVEVAIVYMFKSIIEKDNWIRKHYIR